MVKKPKKIKRYRDMDEEDWGEKFGRRMEKRGREFGEEMEDLGERFSRKMERKHKMWGREGRNWWFRTFGFIGPLLGSILGIVFLAVGILVLNFLNLFLGSSFITSVSNFLFANMYIFFAIFIFSGYNDYFSKRYRSYWVVSPITAGISVVIAFWILSWAISLINTVPKISVLTSISNFLFANLLGIFLLVVVLGYVVVFIKKLIFDQMWD